MAEQEIPPPRPGVPLLSGLLASAQGLLGTLIAIVQTRVELLATELEEEKRRLLAVMAWGVVAVLLGCFGLVFLAVFATVLLWEESRLLVLGTMTALFLGLGGLAWWRVRALLDHGEGMLAASIAELDGDRQALEAAAARARGATPAASASAPEGQP